LDLALAGALSIALGAWMVLRRKAIAESGAKGQNKIAESDHYKPSDYLMTLIVGGSLMVAAGVVLVIVGLV
jgi:hypothetical protein